VRYPLPDGRILTAPSTFTTKTAAGRFLTTVEADLLRGITPAEPAPPVPLQEWAARHVLAQRHRLTPKTYALYDSLLRSCVNPVLGDLQLSSITKMTVREWVADLSARPLSPSRVRQALGLLSQVLDAAIDEGLLTANPCRGVRGPRLPQTEPRILRPEDVAQLSDLMRPPYGLLVDLLAYGGLRIGEAFALRRRSVDLVGQRLVITESLSETAGRHSFGPTKTHQARAVALPNFLCAALTEHLDDHLAAAADALLFTGRTGKPHHYNAFRRSVWDPAATAAGLDGVTPHALRATCATWVADSAGVLEAARRLGHARTSVTTRHYARPVQGRDRDVADQLDALRRGQQNGSR